MHKLFSADERGTNILVTNDIQVLFTVFEILMVEIVTVSCNHKSIVSLTNMQL